MTVKSLNDPFSSKADLRHGAKCGCSACASSSGIREESSLQSSDEMMERAIESAIVRSVFGHSDISRRSFMGLVGGGAAAAALASVFPIDKAKAALLDTLGKPEKTDLNIGFVPITCATPIIMAQPLGFYERYGLNAQVIKTAGWAVARDKSLAGEYDASHMLTPMPLAMTLGAGSVAEPYIMPAVENINGQAIVLSNEHKDKRDPKQWKGFTFGVPFEFSMHNFLLRYYVAEHRSRPRCRHPDPRRAAAGNGRQPARRKPRRLPVAGPVQPARGLGEHRLHPHPDQGNLGRASLLRLCRAAVVCHRTAQHLRALLKSIIDATQYASNPENRKEISAAIAPTNYLNQPVEVIEQVLTGTYADGLGEVKQVPDRIDFDPFPWHSMGVWILTQMKRWGYIEGDIDYKAVAEQVYLASDARKIMTDLGYDAPAETYKSHVRSWARPSIRRRLRTMSPASRSKRADA
jgi:nitrate/nitrite transport system substrate-binding protein